MLGSTPAVSRISFAFHNHAGQRSHATVVRWLFSVLALVDARRNKFGSFVQENMVMMISRDLPEETWSNGRILEAGAGRPGTVGWDTAPLLGMLGSTPAVSKIFLLRRQGMGQ